MVERPLSCNINCNLAVKYEPIIVSMVHVRGAKTSLICVWHMLCIQLPGIWIRDRFGFPPEEALLRQGEWAWRTGTRDLAPTIIFQVCGQTYASKVKFGIPRATWFDFGQLACNASEVAEHHGRGIHSASLLLHLQLRWRTWSMR